MKRRKGCNKKTVQKDWLEDLVVRETMKLIQDDAVIDKLGFVQSCWIINPTISR